MLALPECGEGTRCHARAGPKVQAQAMGRMAAAHPRPFHRPNGDECCEADRAQPDNSPHFAHTTAALQGAPGPVERRMDVISPPLPIASRAVLEVAAQRAFIHSGLKFSNAILRPGRTQEAQGKVAFRPMLLRCATLATPASVKKTLRSRHLHSSAFLACPSPCNCNCESRLLDSRLRNLPSKASSTFPVPNY